jgi:hypothetical protein
MKEKSTLERKEKERYGNKQQLLARQLGRTSNEKPRLYKIIFFVIASAGILLHYFAVYLTRIITFAGIGQEGNPLYYIMGANYFLLFGFAILIAYYSIEWLLKIPNTYKILGASWLTALTAMDFLHDLLFLMGYNVWPFAHFI